MYARQGGAEGYRRFVGEFQPVIARLKAAGIQFGYHNHAHEFIRSPNGLRPFDVLVNEGGPDLMMEIDTYWVAQAGANPAKWLRKCAGRIPVIHDKDMLVVEKNDTDMCPVGEGNLEWDEIIAACEAGGTKWHAVEQDRTLKGRDPFDCLKSSFDFLTAQGL